MSIGRLVALATTAAVLLTPVSALASAPVTGRSGDGVWRQLDAVGRGPSERSAPVAAGVGRYVYVFGGVFDDFASGQFTFLNDLYRLDTRHLRWRPVNPTGPVPPARAFAAAAPHQAYQPPPAATQESGPVRAAGRVAGIDGSVTGVAGACPASR
jgi:hypothetical protein